MKTTTWLSLPLLATLTFACSGSSATDPDTLFEAPSGTVTPDTLLGLWGGKLVNDSAITNRLRFEAAAMTFASRCTKGDVVLTVGVQVKARVSNDGYEILEDKTDEDSSGELKCVAGAQVGSLKKCAADTFGGPSKCFEVSGNTLTLYGISQLDKRVFTKLSD